MVSNPTICFSKQKKIGSFTLGLIAIQSNKSEWLLHLTADSGSTEIHLHASERFIFVF